MTLRRTITRRETRKRARARALAYQARRAAMTRAEREAEDASTKRMVDLALSSLARNLNISQHIHREYDEAWENSGHPGDGICVLLPPRFKN